MFQFSCRFAFLSTFLCMLMGLSGTQTVRVHGVEVCQCWCSKLFQLLMQTVDPRRLLQ